MRIHRLRLLPLALVPVLLASCSAYFVRQRYEQLVQMDVYKRKAWNEMMFLATEYCNSNPGQCRTRLFKLTSSVMREDDWHNVTIPPYIKMLSFYESWMKDNAPKPLPMDERFLDEVRIFALLADSGAITEEQARQLFTQAQRNLIENARREIQQLNYDYQAALASDTQIHEAILVGLAAGVIAVAVVASAAAYSRQPAVSPTIQTFTLTDYSGRQARIINCTSTPYQITCF